ncbi:MAG: hypothetical protein R2706_05260 [Acidimicrobiales bacterium]
MDQKRAAIEANAIENQHGVVRRTDALAGGLNPRQIGRRVERRQWLVGPGLGVYVLAEAANDPLTRLAAAAMGCEAAAWGPSALALWGLRPFPQTPVVATASQLHETIGVEVRSIAALGQLPLVERRGIPTASLELAVISLAYLISERSLHDLIDQVIRDRLTTWEQLERVIVRYRRRWRSAHAAPRRGAR